MRLKHKVLSWLGLDNKMILDEETVRGFVRDEVREAFIAAFRDDIIGTPLTSEYWGLSIRGVFRESASDLIREISSDITNNRFKSVVHSFESEIKSEAFIDTIIERIKRKQLN